MQIGDAVRYKNRLGIVMRQGGTIRPWWEAEPTPLWHVKLGYRSLVATAKRFRKV